jgi:hypothetical protein
MVVLVGKVIVRKCVAGLLKLDLTSTEKTISETFQNQREDATRNCLLKNVQFDSQCFQTGSKMSRQRNLQSAILLV